MVIFFLSGSLKDIIFEGRRLLPNPYLNGQELKSKGRNYMENKDLVRIISSKTISLGFVVGKKIKKETHSLSLPLGGLS